MQQHTLNVLVQDHPGVLNRTVSLLRRRAYNIASLTVGHSEVAGASRMTVVVDATDAGKVVRQLVGLVEVLAVDEVSSADAVQRETVLARIATPGDRLAAVVALAIEDGARVLDVGHDTVILELTDSPERVQAFIDRVRPAGITELRRTGTLAMMRDGTSAADDPPLHSQADGAAGDDQ